MPKQSSDGFGSDQNKEMGVENMISLCMIVCNEEEYLDNCFKNIKWPINEIIVVDTGSTDKTIEIAQKYTSKIYYKKFNNNFSEIRNYSVKKASNPWILVLGADEYIDNDDLDKLFDLVKQMDCDGIYGAKLWRYDYYKNGGWAVRAITRLFKKRDDILFERNVNETVNISIERLSSYLLFTFLKIHHYGFMKDNKYIQNKHERYLDMLKYAINNNEKSLYYYAKEYYLKNDLDTAITLCKVALRIKDNARLCNLLGDIYFELHDFQKANENYINVKNVESDQKNREKAINKHYPYPTKFYIHAANRIAEIYYLEGKY